MSNLLRNLLLAPPIQQQENEQMSIGGFVCPICHGRGCTTDPLNPTGRRLRCTRCAETGRLRAHVSIVWTADDLRDGCDTL